MKPLRAFLYSQNPSGEWKSTAFRELEPLLEAAQIALAAPSASAVIHVGFWRPETEKVAQLARQWTNTLLLSETATGTFPPPISVSQTSIGEIDGLAFRVALDGFGYQIEDPSLSQQKKQTTPYSSVADGSFAPRDWVGNHIIDKPESETIFRNAGIWDDASYHEKESSLATEKRLELALARYRAVACVTVNQTNILDNLQACPNWFLNDKLKYLALTVRMRNVCEAHDLTTIGDLISKGFSGLLKLPNMGQGSVRGLRSLLWRAFIDAEALKRKLWQGSDLTTDGSYNLCVLDEIVIEDAPAPHPPSFASVTDGFIDAAQALTEEERGIWAARIGFRCKQQTLQLIGNQIDLSRERVRQIEVKIYKKINRHPFWGQLSDRLKDYLDDRNSPLLLNGISAVDPWFKGVDELKEPLREVFTHIMDDEFSILDIDEAPVITRLSSAQWEQAVSTSKALLYEMASEKVPEDYAHVQVRILISGPGEELRDELWATVRSLAIWANRPDGKRILAGYGQTAEAVVTAVLESAGHPLHYEEIYRRSKLFSAKEYDDSSIHNAARNFAVLYKPGIYGLFSHCPLTTHELALIEAEVEDITAGAETTKQWHTSELLDELLERGFDFDGQLTKYIINIALRNSPIFVNMGRMIWGYKNSWQSSVASRLDMRQAVLAMLDKAGHPLSTLEIRERLEGNRGLNNHFQIHPQGNLIRLGIGLWGLADRDIKVNDPDGLLDTLAKHLQTTQKGIHCSEVAKLLGGIREADALALLGMVKKKGMRRDRAQYVYLSSWEGCRRIWPAVAVEQALDAHPQGMKFEQVRLEVNRLTKREMSSIYVSSMLIHTEGSIYNHDNELWTREINAHKKIGGTEEEPAATD